MKLSGEQSQPCGVRRHKGLPFPCPLRPKRRDTDFARVDISRWAGEVEALETRKHSTYGCSPRKVERISPPTALDSVHSENSLSHDQIFN